MPLAQPPVNLTLYGFEVLKEVWPAPTLGPSQPFLSLPPPPLDSYFLDPGTSVSSLGTNSEAAIMACPPQNTWSDPD
jgi:hypothetical protein